MQVGSCSLDFPVSGRGYIQIFNTRQEVNCYCIIMCEITISLRVSKPEKYDMGVMLLTLLDGVCRVVP